MGTSTMVGHYVCHLLKDNRWVIYNDDRVSINNILLLILSLYDISYLLILCRLLYLKIHLRSWDIYICINASNRLRDINFV